MKLRQLGPSGLRVSAICLGTMQFGWTADERASFAVMDAFVEAGGNFLDTADVYSSWVPDHPGGEADTRADGPSTLRMNGGIRGGAAHAAVGPHFALMLE